MSPKQPRIPARAKGVGGEGLTSSDILDAAADLFAERGYRATNLEHVAGRLGVTRQALYYYFARKHDILLALFDRIMGLLEQRADATIAENPPDLFLALVRGHGQTVAENISLVTVLLTENAEIREPLHPEAADRRRAYTARLIEAYEAGVAAGTLRPVPNPRVVVNTFIGAMNSMSRWYDGAGKLGPAQIADLATELMEHGVRPVTSDGAR